MDAIRRASAVRNRLNAEKAAPEDGKETVAMHKDSWGSHHSNGKTTRILAGDRVTTEGQRELDPISNQTSSTDTSIGAGSLQKRTSDGPVDTVNSSFDSNPGNSTSNSTGPILIDLNQGKLPFKLNISGNIPSQCQLYVTNTDINVVTCDKPEGFIQRLACGQYDLEFTTLYIYLIMVIVFAWVLLHKRCTRPLNDDEEEGRGARGGGGGNERDTVPSRPSCFWSIIACVVNFNNDYCAAYEGFSGMEGGREE